MFVVVKNINNQNCLPLYINLATSEDSYYDDGAPDEMTMVYPPPKEYSSDDLIHNKKGKYFRSLTS